MAFPIKRYIVLKDGKIIRDYHTADGIEGIHQSIHNEGLDHDEIIEAPVENWDIKVDTHKEEYETGWKMKPLSVRVANGHFKVPENHKLEGEQIVPMTVEDKWKAGKQDIGARNKAVGNDVIPMTDAELIEKGIATKKQLDDERQVIEEEALIAKEMRKMVIDKLKAEGKISKVNK
jgi:hypothetical protein